MAVESGHLSGVFFDIRFLRADADAGGEVVGFYFDEFWRNGRAFCDSERTAGVEMAAGRRVDR